MALLILAACSGTGKSTLAAALLKRQERLKLSVSHTTRDPRPGEIDGVHYHFVSKAHFEELIAAGGFVEWARYAGNLYGTAHEMITSTERAGDDLLFEVEVFGAAKLKEAYPRARSCFVLPPRWASLEERLRLRGTEDEATIQRRISTGREELLAAERFDHLIVNDDFEDALRELEAIYLASKSLQREQRSTLERIIAESKA